MRVFFLPNFITIIIFCLLWPLFQVCAALFCMKIKEEHLQSQSYWFREHKCEYHGRLYLRLGIRKWKRFLPDGGAVVQGGYPKKRLTDFSQDNLNRFLVESCRAELSHWLAILPFWIFGLFSSIEVIWIMLLYALAVNLPCIMAQRFNRPRIRASITQHNALRKK